MKTQSAKPVSLSWIVVSMVVCSLVLATIKPMATESPWWYAVALIIIVALVHLATPKINTYPRDEDVAEENA